jgi:C_GCAxxG_C_C family probable redox protein
LLSAYGERFGLDRGMAFRVAGVFGSGMGRGDACGAVTGAFMVIGLMHGRTKSGDDASQERADELAQRFTERFIAANGTIVCRELLGCDISTSEGLKAAKKEKHFKKRCPKYVRDAAEILEELLRER